MAAVQVDVWRTAYARFLPAAVLAELDDAAVLAAWQRALDTPGEAHLLLSTETTSSEATVTGFAAAEGAEIATLLVAPRWGRRGHAGRLLGGLAERMRGGGAQTGLVWLATEDTASVAFFTRHGWPADGTARTSHHGAETLREQRHSGPLDLAWNTPT